MPEYLWTIILKATVILAAACVLALSLRRASAALRHLIWTSALAALLVLPILSLLAPSWHPALIEEAPIRAVASISTASAAPVASPPAPSPIAWPSRVVFAAAVVSLLAVGRLLLGMVRVRRLAHAAASFDTPLAAELAPRIGVRSAVPVLLSEGVSLPMVFGIFRPAILLPQAAATWSQERLRVVLSHELIHIRRHDPLTQILAQLVCALYWFHPLVWLAGAQFRKERERATDDGVLSLGYRASHYAEHLLELARSFQSEHWSVAVPMAQPSHFESRLRALLDLSRNRAALTRSGAALAAGTALLLLLPLAALHAPAQNATGRLAGIVRDPSGSRVPNASVVITFGDPVQTEITKANMAGEYAFASIPEGTCKLDVSSPGFARYLRYNVAIQANTVKRIDVDLQLGSVSETIEVVGHGARPAQARTTPPQRIRVGGNVQATRMIYGPPPVYPEEAKSQGIEGTVLLQAVISTDGSLLSTRVLNSQVNSALSKAAMDAVQQWRYQPTLLNGVPVEVATTITVHFRLAP